MESMSLGIRAPECTPTRLGLVGIPNSIEKVREIIKNMAKIHNFKYIKKPRIDLNSLFKEKFLEKFRIKNMAKTHNFKYIKKSRIDLSSLSLSLGSSLFVL